MVKLLISILIITVLGLSLVNSITFSNPLDFEGNQINWTIPIRVSIKVPCDREEWNQNFEDYRAGDISKEDMKTYVRSCKW